ncbi:hypothetical protein [Pseudomonas panipatensis]|uniref:hypothetical protein n=2 Tax=Pseudomonas panipatensis TaxID=428992 RepID=UPI0024B81F1B|nr:hypothetical protein [Pseudomonas panipatensis]
MRYLCFWALSFAASAAMANPTAHGVMREAEFGGCHFKLSDHYKGSLRLTTSGTAAVYNLPFNPKLRNSVEVSILFFCDTGKGRKAFTDLGLGNQDGVWVLIPNKSDPQNLARVKLYPLRGNGTSGAASTYDQTTGERSRRFQGLGFCLTDQKQILCGVSEAVGYVAYPKASSLPQVLKLLESIEFLEPAAKSP